MEKVTVYYILYVLFLLVAYIGSKRNSTGEKTLQEENMICFLLVAGLLMLRHQSMGIDLNWRGGNGYLWVFDQAVKNDFGSFFEAVSKNHYEWFFKLYTKIVSLISIRRQFFIAFTAFLSLTPIAVFFSRRSSKPVLSWIIYMGMSPFLVLFSNLRQGLDIGLAVLLYMLAEEKKPVRFLLVLTLAVLVHTSAILLLMIYPAVNLRIGFRARIAGVVILVAGSLFRSQIAAVIEKLFPMYAKYLDVEGTVSYRLFVVFILIYLVCCFYTDGSEFQNAYMNLFFLACGCQLTGLFSEVIPREGFYFMPALCVLLPSIIDGMKSKKLSLVLEMGTCMCFAVFGLYSIYTTYWSMSYPYYWFWQKIS